MTATKTTKTSQPRRAKRAVKPVDRSSEQAQVEQIVQQQSDAADDQPTDLVKPEQGFSLATSAGGNSAVDHTTDVTAMIALGHCTYDGHVPGVGIHVFCGDHRVIASDSATPNELQDVSFCGINIATDVGVNNATKLNVFFKTKDGKVLMGTCGYNTYTALGLISGLSALADQAIDAPFTLLLKQGSSPSVWFANLYLGRSQLNDWDLSKELRNAADQHQLILDTVDRLKARRAGVQPVSVLEDLRSLPAGDAE